MKDAGCGNIFVAVSGQKTLAAGRYTLRKTRQIGGFMKKALAITGLVIAALIAGLYFVMAPALKAMSKTAVYVADKNLTIITGGGGNSAVYVSPDKSSIIIVDTKMGGGARILKKFTDSINPEAKVTIINTHDHPDHTGGNKFYPNADIITGTCDTAKPGALKGTLIKAGEALVIKTADDIIEVRNMGNAHSFADTTVYFRNRKLLMTGDLVFNKWSPVLRKQGGADVDKWTADLDYLMKNYDIKTAVPGHGEVSDVKILQAQKTYFEEIKAAVNDPVKLAALKEKYAGYNHIPIFTGFDQTVKFIKGN
jgi:cyclase